MQILELRYYYIVKLYYGAMQRFRQDKILLVIYLLLTKLQF